VQLSFSCGHYLYCKESLGRSSIPKNVLSNANSSLKVVTCEGEIEIDFGFRMTNFHMEIFQCVLHSGQYAPLIFNVCASFNSHSCQLVVASAFHLRNHNFQPFPASCAPAAYRKG